MKLSTAIIIVFVCFSVSVSAQYQRPFKVYKENNLYGLEDANQTVIVPPKYLDIKTSSFGVFAMRAENNKWGIYNSDGQQITDFIYDLMEQDLPNVIEVRQGSKLGLIAEDGQLLIPVEYEIIAPIGKVILSPQVGENKYLQPIDFEYRGAVVTKFDRRGFVNNEGEIILSIDNERVRPTANFDLQNGFIDIVGLVITKDGRYGIVDEKGDTVISFQYDYINGLKPIGFGELQLKGKKGLYNKKLEVVVEPTFEEIVIINEAFFAGKIANSWTIHSTDNSKDILFQADGIYPFANGYTRVKKDERWSAMSPKGEIVLPFEYDGINPFGSNMLLEKDGKRFIYTSNYEVIPYGFSTEISWRNEKIKLQPAQKIGGKYGFINDDGTFVIEPIYDEVKGFHNEVAIVKKDGLYGFIDTQGQLVQPIEYDIPHLNKEPELLLVKRGGFYGYMNYIGDILIECRYEAIANYGKYMRAKRDGKWGWINHNEEVVVPFDYDFIENYQEDKQQFRYQKGNELGWINRQFESTTSIGLTAWADEVQSTSDDVKYVRVGRYYGLIDSLDNFIIPISYESVIVFDESKKATVKLNGLWGVINDKGEVILPTIYEDNIYTPLQNWLLRQGNQYGIANNQGKILIPVEYDMVYPFINDWALVQKNGKWGYVNRNNEIIIPFEYQNLNSFMNNRAIAQKDSLWGIINQNNEVLLPFKYEVLNEDILNTISATLNGKWGLIGSDYQEIIPFQYDELSALSTCVKVGLNDKYGLYNLEGQLIVQVEYDELTASNNSEYIVACKDGRCGILNNKGKQITRLNFEKIRWHEDKAEGLRKGKWKQIDLN